MRTKVLLSLGAAVFVFATDGTAFAGPVLLGSLDIHGGIGGDTPLTDEHIEFTLALTPQLPAYVEGVGRGLFWGSGDQGTLDFTAESDAAFNQLASLATNGNDDYFQFLARLRDGGAAGGGNLESMWLTRDLSAGDPPDFVGYELVLVRLIVNCVDFRRYEQEPGVFVDVVYDVAYNFYGTPVPEPMTVALAALGAGLLLNRRGAIRTRHSKNNAALPVCGARRGRGWQVPLAVLGTCVCASPAAKADSRHKDQTIWSLWRTGTACRDVCPGIEAHTDVDLVVSGLSRAQGNVRIEVVPFGDFSDNVDGGNGYGYYEVHIGGITMTSGVPGHVSGAPADGKFRKTSGSCPSSCCWHTGNSATIEVTDSFFNSKLGAAGAAGDELFVEVYIPPGSNVPCAAVANGCANMDDGTHRATVTWTPACDPPDCSDGNPCTTDTCVSGVCQHDNNQSSCDDGVYCNGTDACSGGSCGHSGDPCPGDGCCDETNNGCALAITSSNPPDGAIDARQPCAPDGSNPAGWDSVALTMTGVPGPIDAADFTVTVTGGTAPGITNVSVNGDVVTLDLDTFIPTGQWTEFTHDCSGTSTCLGYLPADVSNDRTSAPSDILWLIDCLNGVRTCQMWQCDVDRSDVCGPPDITRVIDLLNGAGAYDPWLNARLSVSPCNLGEDLGGPGACEELADAFLALLTEDMWSHEFSPSDIQPAVRAFTNWVVTALPADERAALAEELQDPSVVFANAVIRDMIPEIVASLRQ